MRRAHKNGETVLVWGDYDVDGVTGTSLLVRTFRSLGFRTLYHIPNRLQDGYGLNTTFLTEARRQDVHVVISVDTGIAGHRAVDHLGRLGVDVILTDHHPPKKELPKAYAVINPLQEGCRYPFPHLSGVGVSYKLAAGITQALFPEKNEGVQEHLDLAAIGTLADVVPMIGENRIIVYHGLKRLERRKKPGLRRLLAMGRVRKNSLSPRDVIFTVSPRINASGRLGSAETALKLLLTDDDEEAEELARQLEEGNQTRRRIERQMLKEAFQKVDREVNFKNDRVIVLEDTKWHPGVVGIVASRILNRFYRPTVVIAVSGELGRGSARSIQGFPLPAVFDRCRKHLEEFGGHPFACGLTLRKKEIQPFRESLNRIASQILDGEDLVPILSVDMEIPLETLTLNLLEELLQLEPFGTGNPDPLFLSRRVAVKYLSQKEKECRVELRQEKGPVLLGSLPATLAKEMKPFLGEPLDFVYQPVIQTEGTGKGILLRVKDFSTSKPPASD